MSDVFVFKVLVKFSASQVGKRWKNLDLFMRDVFVFMVLVKFSASQVGKRWKRNKFGPIYERYFGLSFWLNIQLFKKISVQNLAIMEMIYMLLLFLCNILESY